MYLQELIKQYERNVFRDILIKILDISEPNYTHYNSVFTMPVKGNPNARELWYKNDKIGLLTYSMSYNSETFQHTLTITFIPK